MEKDSVAKTGLVTKNGTYEFLKMPFGLTSAPSTFQRVMSNLLRDFLGVFVYVFINDVIIFSNNMATHKSHLAKVFRVCNEANLRLKRSKCHFGLPQVEYLGHVVAGDGLFPCSRNVDKLLEMATPRSVGDVRSFLGTAGYYRRCIPRFAEYSLPLVNLLKKDQEFVWTKACGKAVSR